MPGGGLWVGEGPEKPSSDVLALCGHVHSTQFNRAVGESGLSLQLAGPPTYYPWTHGMRNSAPPSQQRML